MKNKGFTLAETLITLGIIGIITALILPAINNLRPDKNKVAYLKAYDTIASTIKNLASDSSIYPVCKDVDTDNSVNCSQYPLFNTNKPISDKYNDEYKGEGKLCSLMALALGVATDNVDCKPDAYTFDISDYTDKFSEPSFTTSNGMIWRIVPAVATTAAGGSASFQNDIYIDVNGDERPNCIYSDNCKSPDIFKFIVSADGNVMPADPMGREYIRTRKDNKVRKYEVEDSTIIADANQKNFTFSKCNGNSENSEESENPHGLITPDNPDYQAIFCSTPPVTENGLPVVRNDGFMHNLRRTLADGIYAEVFDSSSGNCTNYTNRKHYMWNPTAKKFELLEGISYVDADAHQVIDNPVYKRLKDRYPEDSHIPWNNQKYKIPTISNENKVFDYNYYINPTPSIYIPE